MITIKTRTIKELLHLMLDNQKEFEEGLCRWNSNIYCEGLINYDEKIILEQYIKKNRPSMFSSADAFKQRIVLEAYYWEAGNITPRIEWLKEHIRKNK